MPAAAICALRRISSSSASDLTQRREWQCGLRVWTFVENESAAADGDDNDDDGNDDENGEEESKLPPPPPLLSRTSSTRLE